VLAKRPAAPYLGIVFITGRSSFWRNVAPAEGIRGLVQVWRENPYRWRVLAVSIVLTALMLYGFLPPNERAEPRKPDITWISTFEPGRSDAQILASNIENQKIKEKNDAEKAKLAAERKEFYRELGRASGFDVDALEREYTERAARTPAQPQSGEPVPAN
jgi:hypothetical protein